MRRRYPSDSYASEKARRLRRIQRRSSVELTRAFESGQLSLRQYDATSRRSIREQKRFVAAQRARIASALAAAQTIDRFLDSLEAETPIRLRELADSIRSAVRG
jgi:hypothetical protein